MWTTCLRLLCSVASGKIWTCDRPTDHKSNALPIALLSHLKVDESVVKDSCYMLWYNVMSFCNTKRHLCCCRYGGQPKHIKIHHGADGSYYLASCHVFPSISVCAAAAVSLIVCMLSPLITVSRCGTKEWCHSNTLTCTYISLTATLLVMQRDVWCKIFSVLLSQPGNLWLHSFVIHLTLLTPFHRLSDPITPNISPACGTEIVSCNALLYKSL